MTADGSTTHRRGRSSGLIVSGWTEFAAVMMICGGLLTIAEGISALAQDNLLVLSRNYAFRFDLTGWGWIHVALGIVVLVTGLALISGSARARPVGVALAGLSLLANFLWLPWYPAWAIIAIVIDVLIIWALCTRTEGVDRSVPRE
ncbi:hypothetical protein [Peterkaempfera sp. SMS 1(5)a]|uniref:DUF7144 family membrane protein n=1 Tax=Peterkaempfera podocarpi TaxID=3232308 RepID=UPI00366B21E6